MKRAAPLALALLAGACHAPARTEAPSPPTAAAPAPPKHARFSLYKFGQRIGVERATIAAAADGGSEVKTTFTFNDRGSDVPLAGQWLLGSDGTPVEPPEVDLTRRLQVRTALGRGTFVDDAPARDPSRAQSRTPAAG